MGQKKIFISYDYHTDRSFIEGIEGLNENPNIETSFVNLTIRKQINKSNKKIMEIVKNRINESDLFVVLVGENTNDLVWIQREFTWAKKYKKEIIFMRRKGNKTSEMNKKMFGNPEIQNWNINLFK